MVHQQVCVFAHKETNIKAALWNFSFCVDLAIPVDKGGSVSRNVRVTCFLHFAPRCKEATSPGGELAAAPETDLQLTAEATGIQPEQTPPSFHLMLRKHATRWKALRITMIR